MNQHLACVRELHQILLIPQAGQGHLSDIEIIEYQSLLMEAGGGLGQAIKSSEITRMLAALVDLAYIALAALDKQDKDVMDTQVSWERAHSVRSVMRVVTDKIGQCISGEAAKYSEVYHLCHYLALSFLNCDFEKAFAMTHSQMADRARKTGESFYSDSLAARKLKMRGMPDLSECLYE